MRKQHQPNTNPLVERIVQAYLKTHLTDIQFEALVEQALEEAKSSQTTGDATAAYEKGFSNGYDEAKGEHT